MVYFRITEAVPYLLNGTWPHSAKTNSVTDGVERSISINTLSVNPLSLSRRCVEICAGSVCKAVPGASKRKRDCLGGHLCSSSPFS